MSNKTTKPKKTTSQLISMMRNDKGITFNYISEEKAADFLSDVNNYMRTASYRKNYTKVHGGPNDGKYERLDFAYLKEMSTIDMHFRFIISKMCLDIEHALKVRLINDIENNSGSDGYDIVKTFFNQNPDVVHSLEKMTNSPFTGDLIQKYFTIKKTPDPSSGKKLNQITYYDDCPAWVLVEILSYGEFIRFYNAYYGNSAPIKSNLLHLVRSLRNGTAHNNCILADLKHNTSIPPVEIKIAVQQILEISKSQRQKKLSTRPMLEFVTMLYVYNKVVSEKVKYHHVDELKNLFFNRMLEKKAFFRDNDLIRTNYEFACKIIDNFFD